MTRETSLLFVSSILSTHPASTAPCSKSVAPTQCRVKRGSLSQMRWQRKGGALQSLRAGNRVRTNPIMSANDGEHDYSYSWPLPSSLPDQYVKVRVLSLGPHDSTSGSTLLTLLPVEDEGNSERNGSTLGKHNLPKTAFRMSISEHQAKAIRDLIIDSAQRHSSCLEAATMDNQNASHRAPKRPTAHMLLLDVLSAHDSVVSEAAITHVASDVFIASIFLKTSNNIAESSRTENHHGVAPKRSNIKAFDARPSDAIAIAAQANAPLYLHRDLLGLWQVSVRSVQLDAAAGLCECLPPFKSLFDIHNALRHEDIQKAQVAPAPQYIRLGNLCAQLDAAVRCERFQEAAKLRDEINDLCPLERLREALQVALRDQRYLDAAHLRDEISIWEQRLAHWEAPIEDEDTSTPKVHENIVPWLPWLENNSATNSQSCDGILDATNSTHHGAGYGESAFLDMSSGDRDIADKSVQGRDIDGCEPEQNDHEQRTDLEQ